MVPAAGARYMLTMPGAPTSSTQRWYVVSSASVPCSASAAIFSAASWLVETRAHPSATVNPVSLSAAPASSSASPLRAQLRILARPASAAASSLTWIANTGSGVSPPVSTAATAARSPSQGSMSAS